MRNIDDLTKEQKIEFVVRMHEMARLAEEWAASSVLSDEELERFQELCSDFGVSESSLLHRYQRTHRALLNEALANKLPVPKFFEQLPLPKRQPMPVPPPLTDLQMRGIKLADRDAAYGGPTTGVITTQEELRRTVPPVVEEPANPEHQLPHTDAEATRTLDPDSSSLPNVVKDPKAKRQPGPPKAKVLGPVPAQQNGKIKMAPPEVPAEQTTTIPTVTDEESK